MASKKPYFVVAFLVTGALGLSYFLIPRAGEIALMQMKDKHFEEALAMYEKQKTEGKLTVEIAGHLSELYLQKGSVDKAIAIMEAFVADHPTDLDARNRLGTFYQYAQRNDDYMRNLEEINRLTPSPDNLKTLSDIYNFNADYDKQSETLKALIESDKGKDPKNFIDRANILAAKGDYAEAIATLAQMKTQHAQSFGPEPVALLVSLLLDQNRGEEALKFATEWQKDHPQDLDTASRLIAMLHYKGTPELAEKLMAAYNDEQINSHAGLLQEYVQLEIGRGQEERAYDRLVQLADAGKLPDDLKDDLLSLAISRGNDEMTRKALDGMDLKTLSEPQLTALVELAATRDDKELLSRLRDSFHDEDSAAAYPVLTTLLAVANHEDSAAARLAALEKTDLTAPVTLRIARTCARSGRPTCTRTFLGKLPPTEQMTDGDIASAADLYLELKSPKDGQALLDAVADHDTPMLKESRLKYAAAAGNAELVQAWLDADGKTARTRLLADLFFLTYNNNHLDLAASLAETLHVREDTELSRSILAQVYVKTGQYEQAILLLRDNATRSPEDESNYVFALAKLSTTNEAYRRELGEYAEKRLRADLPRREKLALVYALVTAKQMGPAMPYIRELAMKEGGQWAALYAETLDKQGRHDEARKFWISLASQPGTSASDQRTVAYNLLGHGYRADAEPIFFRLAQKAPAKSKEVRELLYLWGPRPDADKLEWMVGRMETAKGAEQESWATLIANTTSDETMIDLGARHPIALRSPALAERYLDALSRQGDLAARFPEIEKLARDQGRTDLLKLYARAATNGGHRREARAAYDVLYDLKKGDITTLRESGTLAYAQADYSSSKRYLANYIAADETVRKSDVNAYDAYFVHAETLRRDGDKEQARAYYGLALEEIEKKNATAELMSKKAQALVWYGKTQEGIATFDEALRQYPNDDTLRADYAATLLELQRYASARDLLAKAPLSPAAGTAKTAEAAVPKSVTSYTIANGNGEIAMRFSGGEHDVAEAAKALRAEEGVAYVSEGYDSLVAGAAEGHRFEVKEDPEPRVIVVNDPAASESSARQTVLRYQLLAARLELETGEVKSGTERLNSMLPTHPGDTQLMGFAANAENYGGNWPRAQALLASARRVAPENEDIAILDDDMRRISAPGVKLDGEWISRGNDDEFVTTLAGYFYLNEQWLAGAVIQNNRFMLKNDRVADGRIGNFDGNRQRAEIYAIYSRENGQYVRGALYANNDTLGAGAAFHFLSPLGETEIIGEWRRPFWEFAESVYDDTTRDRIALEHTIKPRDYLTISGGPAYTRYRVDGASNVFSAAGGTLAVVYRLIDAQPFVALGYGFDAEYEISSKKNFDANGAYTEMTPLRTREVHFFSVTGGYHFTPATYGEGVLGYGWDRFGSNGPSIEGRLTQEFTKEFDGQVRASYGFDNGRNGSNVTRAGGYLRWKY